MWDLIVSVPGHCRSFYFLFFIKKLQSLACLLYSMFSSLKKTPTVRTYNS